MANTININVNKTDLGLNNVDNTSDLNKPISTATQTALNGKEDVANKENTTLDTSSTKYPTNNLVKTNLDLKDNITTSQTATLEFRFDKKHIHATTGIGGALAPLTGNITLFSGTNKVNVTSVMLHNDSVEPTFSSEFERSADSLPYVTGQDNIIVATMYNQNPTKVTYKILRSGTNIYGTFLTTSLKGAINGLAELDGSGKVPSGQLPSYVDDVVEVADFASLPVTGESGKIYVTLDNNLTFRWSGSAYVEISASLALGELSTTAYRGDRGATAYNHSQLTSGNPHNVTKSDVGLSNVANSDTTTTANITDSSNKRFVTDAQLVVIGNTSGTNTGDQDLSNLATKNVTLDRKVASYVLQASDNNKLIEMNVGSGNSVTINNSIFSAGNQILVAQYGSGQVTFTAGLGVTLRSASGKLKLTGQYSMATIVAISASEFYIAGDLTA
jgi:hypothetical protein